MVEFTLWEQEGTTKIVWHEPKERKTDACVIVFPGGGYAALLPHRAIRSKMGSTFTADLSILAHRPSGMERGMFS